MTDTSAARVGVVLVNWRGWRDTLLSLETLFGGSFSAFDVVVVDNASGDDSIDHIIAWAEGREMADVPAMLAGRVHARAEKHPVPYVLLQEEELAASDTTLSRLTVIQASRNTGFAGGNNLGLDYLRRRGGYDYFWLLNNDAFPAPDALAHLVARARANPGFGLVGSTLAFAGRPDVVQALGGAEFDATTGRAYHIGADSALAALPRVDSVDVERRMAYVIGASMLASARFLDQIGLMEEGYFLYFEELDWAERGKPNFALGYARDSLVYHKAGGSTQSAFRRSTLAAYYLARNRLVFTRRFHPECIATVLRGVAVDALRYVVRARWSEAKGFARAMWEAIWQRRVASRS